MMLRQQQLIKSFLLHSAKRSYSSNATPAVETIGFIGLGQMGSRMAPHLVRKAPTAQSSKLFVFDTNDKIIQQLIDENPEYNIIGCSSPSEVAKQVNTLITMLPGPNQVKQVYKDIASHVKSEDAVFVDSSTIDPTSSQVAAQSLLSSNGSFVFVDAPVSGGVNGAAAGTLTFMVGGVSKDSAVWSNRIIPVLSRMGKNIVACGENVGAGEAAKICNNLVLGITMSAVSEALVLGEKLGMDPKVLSQIFNTSTARCWSSDSYNPYPGVMENVPSSKNYEGGFACALMLKDLKLAELAAGEVGQKLNFGGVSIAEYEKAVQEGLANKDFSAILQHFKNAKE